MKPKSIFVRREFPCRISLSLPAVSLAAMLAIATGSADASSLTWDGNSNTAPNPDGGTGTWDTNTTANWWDGASNVNWPAASTGNDDALFANNAGTVTISPVTANDLTFSTTGYILSGASTLTLDGTTPTITLGSGISATLGNNTATILAGSAGLTKSGAGTLTLSGNAANTLTGGVTARGGTLALSLANLATPTNLLNSGNALKMHGGATLAVTGKNGAFNSAQTVNGTTAYAGTSAVTVNNASGTSTTMTLGTISQAEIGGVLCMYATNGGTNVPNTTSQIVKASNTINSYIGSWAIAGDSKGATARWAYLYASGQITSFTGTAANNNNLLNVTDPAVVYTHSAGNHTIAGNRTAFGLQNNEATARTITLGNFDLTTNGLSKLQAATDTYTTSGSGRIVVGAANELVAMGVGNLTLAAPVANGAGGNSNLTYAGGGTLLLSATNTYSGLTSVNSGTMQIGTNGSVNSSSGIKVNGGKLLQTNTATPISPTVTVQGGTIDGTGTINTVNVSDLATNKITNGNGGTTALTVGALVFNGDAAVDIRTAGAAGLTVTGALSTTPANGTVTVNLTSAPAWVTGTTYNLIGYGSWSGSVSDFTLGTVPGMGARQTASLGSTGATNGFITLSISGDSILWTGGVNGDWSTTAIGSPFNWKTQPGGTGTEFLVHDDVVFDDTATGTTTINILDADVSTNTITFNNSTKSYAITSALGWGIAGGSLTKNGSGTLSISTYNTYTGATTVNNGTLEISGGSAIANTGLVTLANSAGAVFRVIDDETIGSLGGGGGAGGTVNIESGKILTLSSGTQTFAGTISGDADITVSGANQSLASANSYTGTTTVNSGGLIVSANNALGSTANGTTVTGTGSGTPGGALGFSGGVNYSTAEAITGSGIANTVANSSFPSVQRGFVQGVSGHSTFAGNIKINATGVSRIGTQNGAQLTLSGTITMADGVTTVQPLFRAGENDGDYVTLANTGNSWDSDTLIYTGNNNSAQSAGLRLGTNNAHPTAITVQGASSSQAATTFDMAGYNQTLNGLIQGLGQLKILNSAAATTSVLTLNNLWDRSNNNTAILDGAGRIAVVKQGGFSQGLGAVNTYTGTTTIQGGTLLFTKQAALYNNTPANWTPANITVDSGATLSLSLGGTGEFTPADVATIAANLTSGISNNGLKAGSFLGLQATVFSTVSSVLTDSTGAGGGAVGLVKTGGVGLVLDQNNTYSGGTFHNDGYLYAAHNNAFGTGPVTIGAGAERLNILNGINVPNAISITAGGGTAGYGLITNRDSAPGESVTVSGTITINGSPLTGGHFSSTGIGSILTITGAINSAATPVTQRAGTVIYSGGGSYASLDITGTGVLGANNGLDPNAALGIGLNGAGIFDLAGYNQSLAGITKSSANTATIGNSSTASDSTLTITGNATFAGVIQDTLAGGTRKLHLVKSGAATSLVLSGANTYSGDTTVLSGTLDITTASNFANGSTIRLTTGATLNLAVAGTDTVKDLYIDNVQQATGKWGRIGSITELGADFETDIITGDGLIEVVAGYDAWAATNSVTEGPNGDDDKDGISNLVEYALGLPPHAADPSPGTLTGNLLSFNKGAAAVAAGDVTYTIETSTTLAPGSWSTVVPDINDATKIEYTLPTGVGGRIFGRLKVLK